MRDNRRVAIIVVGGLLIPIALAWWIYVSDWIALLIISAPWINWSIYTIGALCGAALAVLGSYMMRSYWMLVAALGALYCAVGYLLGGLQSGNNPMIAPDVAFPYIRCMWLLGGLALFISTMAVLKTVVRIVPAGALKHGLDQNDADSTD